MSHMEGKKAGKGRGKKLCYLLGRLSAQELIELREWLGAPLHCGSSQLALMFDIVLDSMNRVPSTELRAIDFSDLLMPQRPMERKKEQYIWVRLTQLYHEALEFLAWKRLERSPSLRKVLLMEEICYRGWERLIPETYEASLGAKPIPEGATQFRKVLSVEIQYSHYLAAKPAGKDGKHLSEIHQSLDHYFILQKLKYACAGVIEGDPTANPDTDVLLSKALEWAEENEASLPKVIGAYFHVFRLLRAVVHHATTDLRSLKAYETLYANPAIYDQEEAMDLFGHGQNYCILMYRLGNADALALLQRLYDAVLDSGVAATHGLIQPSFYKNAAELMCRLGSLDWVAEFLERYKHLVSHDPQGLTYQYCLAALRFHQSNFEAVPRLLYNILSKIDAMEMGLGARIYLCQSLWEIRDWDWLSSIIGAFGQFLRRVKGLEPTQLVRHRQFLALLKRAYLAMLEIPKVRDARLLALQAEIESTVPAGLFQWLRDKISEALDHSDGS